MIQITINTIINHEQATRLVKHFSDSFEKSDTENWTEEDFEGKTIVEAAKHVDPHPHHFPMYVEGIIEVLNIQ